MTDSTEPTPGWTFVGRDGIPRPVKLIGGIHDVLPEVNRKRREVGRDPLTNQQAHDALTDRNIRGDDAMADFLIGYVMGFPMPSIAGVVGAVLHAGGESDASHHASATSFTTEAPVSPEPAASSYGSGSSDDSGSSSSSSDSGGGSSE